MMIDTVIFDMGGTIEHLSYTDEERLCCKKRIQRELIKASAVFDIPFEVFERSLMDGYSAYKLWSTEAEIECRTEEIWADWYLRDFPQARQAVVPLAAFLSEIWETTFYTRSLRPEAKALLDYLEEQGYKQGVISNTSSCTQPYRSMEEYGIRSYFACVLLSAAEGSRKPAPAMFEKACRLLGSQPERCMYVGDQIGKDVLGARRAGYGANVLIGSDFTVADDKDAPLVDYRVQELTQIIPVLEKIGVRRPVRV